MVYMLKLAKIDQQLQVMGHALEFERCKAEPCGAAERSLWQPPNAVSLVACEGVLTALARPSQKTRQELRA